MRGSSKGRRKRIWSNAKWTRAAMLSRAKVKERQTPAALDDLQAKREAYATANRERLNLNQRVLMLNNLIARVSAQQQGRPPQSQDDCHA